MRTSSVSASAGALLLLSCGLGGGPTLQPFGPQQLRVNETFTLRIGIDNPQGRAVRVRVEDPDLPAFDRVTSIATSGGGATFNWAPLSSQTGTHELTFVLTDAGGGGELDRESALFEVLASDDAAPVFVRPSAGGTYDLEVDPCVTFDIEVRDDDSEVVAIDSRSELPERAAIINQGNKRATFDWCPTPDQAAAAERWTIELYADDGEHPQVEHDYIVVLRTGPKEGCPGAFPTVNILRPAEGERVVSGTSYAVEVEVTDDMGLRDAPLLYYTTTAPDDPSRPDVTEFEQVSFEAETATTYRARIPSLGLEEGEMQEVFMVVSATDNDDPSGSVCDHRTDSELRAFFAEGGLPPDGSLRECDYCTASTECASGICANIASGGRCVEACSDTPCATGVCGATVTTEGGTRAGCGPASEICGSGGGACTDDGREDDDAQGEATPYSSPITDGQICAADPDFFSFAVGDRDQLEVTVDGFSHSAGDLDLELRNSAGVILATSASIRDSESVSYCHTGASTTLYARVFGFGTAQNAYQLSATTTPNGPACCTDDAAEDDDTQAAARSLVFEPDSGTAESALVEGTVCPGDDDWLAIPMDGPGTIDVEVDFTHSQGDIDISLYAPDGTRLESSAGVVDGETLRVDVAGGGTFALRVFGYSRGNEYAALITRSVGSGCASTSDCPVGTVCGASGCVADVCTVTADCPSMHECVTTGPVPARRACGFACDGNSDCRSSEACKWTAEGRACGRRGSGANGDSCASFGDCGGQRHCIDWPGGYCARQGCSSDGDCEADTRCVRVGDINACVLRCVSVPCREAEGYQCELRATMGDGDRFVCVPPGG